MAAAYSYMYKAKCKANCQFNNHTELDNNYQLRINGPRKEDFLLGSDTKDTWLSNSILVELNGWVNFVVC